MPTQWIYRVHVIVPEADKATANLMAADIHPDFENSFQDANVSANGVFPPTHIFVNSSAKQDMLDGLSVALPNWASYELSIEPQYWVMRVETGELLMSNISAAEVGNTWGGVDSANTLAAAGLAWTRWPEEE